MARKNNFGNLNTPQQDQNPAPDEHLYGPRPTDLPKSGRVVARGYPISKISPDRQQPRQLIPAAARADWNGAPPGIPAVLMRWQRLVQDRVGQPVPVRNLIRGEDTDIDITVPDPHKPDKRIIDPIAEGFLKVVYLAGSIHKDGQINPITIYEDGMNYIVETGERRLLAHHMLRAYLNDEKYATVLATTIDKPSPWRQAVENNARDDLNAIGKARQLALLIMAMYRDEDGVEFASYDEMKFGDSDRPFYAQVADGIQWRIKRGYGDRIQEAMGLSNRNMLSNYRSLLKIPDSLWLKASEEGWTEGRIRTKVDEIEGTNRSGQYTEPSPESGDMSPIGDISHPDDTLTPFDEHPPSHEKAGYPDPPPNPNAPAASGNGWTRGDRIVWGGHYPGIVVGVDSANQLRVQLDDDPPGSERSVLEHELEREPEPRQFTTVEPTPPQPEPTYTSDERQHDPDDASDTLPAPKPQAAEFAAWLIQALGEDFTDEQMRQIERLVEFAVHGGEPMAEPDTRDAVRLTSDALDHHIKLIRQYANTFFDRVELVQQFHREKGSQS